MKKQNIFFALLLFTTLPAYALTPQATFKAAFDGYQSPELSKPSASTAARAQQYDYVFVAGFLNEGIHAYFEDNIQTLKRAGIRSKNIHVIRSRSSMSVRDSIYPLGLQLVTIHRKSGRKMIIIAHSRGGAETLGATLRYPELLDQMIEKVILIQSALGGSPLADYVSGQGPKLSDQVPLLQRMHFQAVAGIGAISNYKLSKGTFSLRRQSMAELWADLFSKANPRTIEQAHKKIHYIISHKDPADMSFLVDCTGWYLQTSFGPNDGMILLQDQYIPGLGTTLATLNADHTDLTTSGRYTSMTSKIREAVTSAILQIL